MMKHVQGKSRLLVLCILAIGIMFFAATIEGICAEKQMSKMAPPAAVTRRSALWLPCRTFSPVWELFMWIRPRCRLAHFSHMTAKVTW
ncbi:MAG: hypothetical protein ACXWMS_09265 [Syntrophales bacterium]